MTIKLLDTVVLDHDVPEHALLRGDLGTVVEIYDSVDLEVEFGSAGGFTAARVTLEARDVRPMAPCDLFTVRPFEPPTTS